MPMEGVGLVGLVVLLAIVPVSLVVLSWMAKPHAMRELARGEIKTRPLRYRPSELAARRTGCYAEFGLDYHTHQPFVLPQALRCTNFLSIGAPNSGKTFYLLHTLLWRDIAYRDNAVIVFDSQRDLTEAIIALCERARREYIVFPDAGYNPLGGEGSARDRAEAFADLIAQSAETAVDAESRFYVGQEQDFVRVMLPLYEAAYHQPMILQELIYLCKLPEYRERLRRDVGIGPERTAYDVYVATLSQAHLLKVLAGLVSTIQKLTVGERIVLHNTRVTTSIAACIAQRRVIIIREGGTKTSRHRPLGLLYMIAVQNAILSRDPAHPGPFVAVYLDECYKYFNRDFAEFINANRKYNTALHLGFQTLEQLRPHINEILTGCGTWAIHARLMAEDAKVIADNIGERLFALKSINQSSARGRSGLAQTETTGYDYLFPPHYIRNLPERYLLLLSIEGRETAAVRTLIKPTAQPLRTSSYVPPQVGAYPPPTIWDERDDAAAAAAVAAPADEPTSGSNPRPRAAPGVQPQIAPDVAPPARPVPSLSPNTPSSPASRLVPARSGPPGAPSRASLRAAGQPRGVRGVRGGGHARSATAAATARQTAASRGMAVPNRPAPPADKGDGTLDARHQVPPRTRAPHFDAPPDQAPTTHIPASPPSPPHDPHATQEPDEPQEPGEPQVSQRSREQRKGGRP